MKRFEECSRRLVEALVVEVEAYIEATLLQGLQQAIGTRYCSIIKYPGYAAAAFLARGTGRQPISQCPPT